MNSHQSGARDPRGASNEKVSLSVMRVDLVEAVKIYETLGEGAKQGVLCHGSTLQVSRPRYP